jgi:predicted acyl esterase
MAERILTRRFGLGPATTRYRVRHAVTVPMRDGVNLLADHYAPVTSSPAGRCCYADRTRGTLCRPG